jgi:hypothetical protein
MIEPTEPDSGDVYDLTSGEKARIEYDRVFIYRSSGKGKQTVVELGYSPDLETVYLDISFETFDAQYQANRKAWKEYWRSQSNNSLY